ncbi:hypothetical protein D9M73_72130 [compost metagenome]
MLVEPHQKVYGAFGLAVDFGQIGLQQGRGGLRRQVRCELPCHGGFVFEGELFGCRFQEKIKRVEHHHVNHKVHRDLEFPRRLRENQPGLVVCKRVLLPVDEVVRRLDLQRIRQHLGPAVRGRAQAHNLRPQLDQSVVFVMGDVAEGNVDGQDGLVS